LSLALEGLGASIWGTDTVADALAFLRSEHNAKPHVVVADIGMPREDGYAFLKAVGGLGDRVAAIPVIAVTAYAGADNETRALTAGFRLQCTKPVDPEVVAQSILEVLD
jgi:hypothetical protein